jgi:hypothetical protein
MTLAGPAAMTVALVLVLSPLVAGCGTDPTCDDVSSLQHRLDGMSTDDPDYNTTVEELGRAEADCNG